MSKSPRDKAESIRHQLRNALRQRGEDMQFGLQRYAIERFLYRLGVSAHRDRFILKGAALFALWGGAIYRPTRDLDFTGYGSPEEEDVLAALRDICRVPDTGVDLVFDPGTLSAEPIRDDSEYHGLRIRLAATLGGSRIPIQIDIGFGKRDRTVAARRRVSDVARRSSTKYSCLSTRIGRRGETSCDGCARRTQQSLQGLLRSLRARETVPIQRPASCARY